jgi:NAD(P)-dependent dehydrogenase (short-subunit alcohol dehydrogenase family)
MREFHGKGAIVTGAASGIGLGIARCLAKAGANVALLDIEAQALERARADVAALGGKVVARRTDVSDRYDVARAAAEIEAALGKVHLVFNNAGVEISGTRLEDIAEAEWDWIIGVNVYGVVNGIRYFVPLLRKHGESAHVVNTASLAGFWVNPHFRLGPYSATKYAVVALSEALEQDFQGSNIGVSVLCPGAVNTNIHASARNRPSRFGPAPERVANEGLRAALAQGLSGEQVGERVLRAIRAGEFYVFTHEAPKEWFAARFKRILDAFAHVPGQGA